MKKSFSVSLTCSVFVMLCLFTSSCSDINNEIWFEKDGSGRMEVRVDIAAMFPDEMGGLESITSEMQDSIQLEDDAAEPEEKDQFEAYMDMLMKDGQIYEIDTVVYSDKREGVSMHLQGYPDKGEAWVTLMLEFDDSSEFDEFFSEDSEGGFSLAPQEDGSVFELGRFDHEQKYVVLPILKVDGDELAEESGMGEMGKDEEEMAFLENMFGYSITTVHMPGKIVFTNDSDAEVDGRTVVFRRSLFAFFGDEAEQRIIKYK